MNQFTTETIINSFYLDAAGTKPMFEVVGNKFIAKKLFAFNVNDIKAVYKAGFKAEESEEATLTIPTAAHTYVFEGNTITSDAFRLHIKMKTVDANISEFQNSLTRNNKEYNFEVKYSANSNTGANDSMAEALEKAINMQNRESKNKKFDVTVFEDTLTFTAIDGFTRFETIEFQALETNYLGYNAFTVVANGSITKAGESGFGTTNWLMRNFRIPTYVNTNWLSLRQDDRPIPGVKYNQYTFHVEADRGELTGMGAVGQKMTSKTTHVLYVAESASAEFEKLFANSLIPFVDYDKNGIGDEAGDFSKMDAVTAMKTTNTNKMGSADYNSKTKAIDVIPATSAETAANVKA